HARSLPRSGPARGRCLQFSVVDGRWAGGHEREAMNGMPRPNQHHEKLHLLAGTFVGEETLHPSPWSPGGIPIGHNERRVDLDGFVVIQECRQARGGGVAFRGHGVFGWDDRSQSYLWYGVDSMGQMPAAPTRGQWQGDTLVFEQEADGRRSRYTYVF